MLKWTPEADQSLLSAILRIHCIRVDHEAVAKDVGTAHSEKVTATAIQRRIQAIREKAAKRKDGVEEDVSPRLDDSGGEEKATPMKQSKPRKKKEEKSDELDPEEV